MEEYQITCKVHDNLQRVVSVGINGKIYSTTQVWDWINSKKYSFFTKDHLGNVATVKKAKSSTGRKYITTHPDGITDNNLDELSPCE